MDWSLFAKWYIAGCIPVFSLALINIIDRIKFKKYSSVRVSGILYSICILSLFVSLFGGLTHLLDVDLNISDNYWFIAMMFLCYFSMIIFCLIIYNEKIIYDKNSGDIVCSINFRKTKINVSEITRFNFSDEFIDIYIKDKRIRYRINFLTGKYEFEQYLKAYWNE